MVNPRATVFEITQIGPEGTLGVSTAATKRIQSLQIIPEIKTKTNVFQPQGWKYNAAISVDQEWTEAKVTGIGDYASLIYPLSGLFGVVTPSTPTGGTNSRAWVWNPTTSTPETPKSFTVESGSSARAGKFTYGVFNEFEVAYTREEVKVSGTMFGQRYQDGISLTAQPSEVETLTITGTPTGGTFTLTFNGQTTANIAFNAASAAVVSALVALPNIGAGGVTATGGALPGTPVVITFAAGLANQHQSLITANSAGLTGGSTPTATVAETTPGGLELTAVPIFPTHNTLYIDSSAANLGVTAIPYPFEYSWKLSNKWGMVWPINATNTSFATHVETDPKLEIKLMLEADANGMTYLTQFRAGTSVFLRMSSVGPIIESAITDLYNADFCAKITDVKPFKDHKGVWAIEYTLEGFSDPVWGQSMAHTIQNVATAL